MIKVNKIKKNLLKKDSIIKNVIDILNKEENKICIIVNSQNVPQGIFTDEDIRRIIIKKNYNNIKVVSSYNKKFKYCFSDDDEISINKIFRKYSWVNILLVINRKNRKLEGIIDKDIFKSKITIENEVLILAGGLGERLKPLTNFLPKPMLNFSGRPLLESTIYSLKSSGFKNINISVNYQSSKIIDYFGDGSNYNILIKYFKEKKKLGTAGPLYFLKNKKLPKSILVINGDIYTSLNYKNLIKFHESKKNDITVCCHDFVYKLQYGLIEKKKKLISEKPETTFLINSGIYVFNSNLLKHIKKKQYLNMDELVNKIYAMKKKVGIFKIHEDILDIGTFSAYEYAKNLVK